MYQTKQNSQPLDISDLSVKESVQDTDDTKIIIPNNISLNSSKQPSDREIKHMAKNLGIDLSEYPQLIDLVIKAIKEPIPPNWAYLKNSSKFCVINMENQEIQDQQELLQKFRSLENFQNQSFEDKKELESALIESIKYDDFEFKDSSLINSLKNIGSKFQGEKMMTFNNLDNTNKKTVEDIFDKINHLQNTVDQFASKIQKNERKLENSKKEEKQIERGQSYYKFQKKNEKKDEAWEFQLGLLREELKEVREGVRCIYGQFGIGEVKLGRSLNESQQKIYQLDCFKKWMLLIVGEKQQLTKEQQKIEQLKIKVRQKKKNLQKFQKQMLKFNEAQNKKVIESLNSQFVTNEREFLQFSKELTHKQTILQLQNLFLKNFEQSIIDQQHIGNFSTQDEKYFEQRFKEYQQIKESKFEEESVQSEEESVEIVEKNEHNNVLSQTVKLKPSYIKYTHTTPQKVFIPNDYYGKSQVKDLTRGIMQKYNVRESSVRQKSARSAKSEKMDLSVISKISQKTNPINVFNPIKTRSIERVKRSLNFNKNHQNSVFKDLRGEVDKLLNTINQYQIIIFQLNLNIIVNENFNTFFLIFYHHSEIIKIENIEKI